MKVKSIITVLVAAPFLLSLASLSLAAGDERKWELIGKVAKIEGNKVTIQDDMGKETTVEVKDVKDTKVGGKVKIEGGVIENVTGEPGMSKKRKLSKDLTEVNDYGYIKKGRCKNEWSSGQKDFSSHLA
jgi:hypothetical protein